MVMIMHGLLGTGDYQHIGICDAHNVTVPLTRGNTVVEWGGAGIGIFFAKCMSDFTVSTVLQILGVFPNVPHKIGLNPSPQHLLQQHRFLLIQF